MTSYRGLRADSPWPLPVPATTFAVGTRPGRPVAPSGSVGDTMRAQRGGAPIVPAVSAGAQLLLGAGRQLPRASTGTGPPPIARPATTTATTTGATAVPPIEAPPAPNSAPPASIDSGPSAPAPEQLTNRGRRQRHDHREYRR
jgi:hypothetical protein